MNPIEFITFLLSPYGLTYMLALTVWTFVSTVWEMRATGTGRKDRLFRCNLVALTVIVGITSALIIPSMSCLYLAEVAPIKTMCGVIWPL